MKTMTMNARELSKMCAELVTNTILANIKRKRREAEFDSTSKEA